MPPQPSWRWGPPGEWVADAACSPQTADLFHPDMRLRRSTDQRLYRQAVAEAKRICAGCPVIAQCREHSRNEMLGVWGGLSAEERGFNGCGTDRAQRRGHPAFQVVLT